jgi:DMSO/TMAO reductase YedYZ molybdopterin-dependent catalytic subunit
MTARSRLRAWPMPALAGIASVALGLGVAELVAALIAPTAGPILVVGSAAIDLAPPWAKDAAIALFGTGDKAALIAGIALVLLIASAAAGVLQAVRPPLGRILIGIGAVLGVGAAITRAGATAFDAVPSAVAAIVAAIVLGMLLRRAPRAARDADPSRRTFLAWAGGATVLGALTAAGGLALESGARAVTAVREALKLPRPAVAAPAVPAGAQIDVEGMTPVITPNAGFYRIDTALQIPRIDPADWTLRIHGMVDREVVLTWDELLALPLEESRTTLMCVSNEVGGSLIGTALWLGYPIRELLSRARPTPGADMVLSRSIDGFTASSPLEVLQEEDRNAILAVGMNGEPLPPEHGFPVRMVVPGLYGYVSATKWVVELEVTTFDRANAYWTDRGWSARGPIKLGSRIDVARGGTGAMTVAGVAWHQHTGISGVQVQIDGGAWQDAELAEAISVDTWVQWRYDFAPRAGDHEVAVRAIGADGEVQTADVAGVVPDGATGHHTVRITAA